jgi:hypothetical protein
MAQSNRQQQHDRRIRDEDLQSPLQQYYQDRVQANVRRTLTERAASTVGYPDAPSIQDNPRKAAVLRETAMESAFEYVNYHMPETTCMEIVQGRQIDRDMKDPGIFADGPRVEDIVHLPPRHARLATPAARLRSSRDVLLSRDRQVAAGDLNVESLPRPYVPRGVIDTELEPYPYQHHEKNGSGRIERSRLITSQAPELRGASRNLQKKLGTTNPKNNLDNMTVIDVRAAVNRIIDVETSRDTLLSTPRQLQQNWVPIEGIMLETGIGTWVVTLRGSSDSQIATLATEIDREWREAIRNGGDNRNVQSTGFRPTEDPFTDVDSNLRLFGQTIRSDNLYREVARRRQAGLDYNRAAADALRQRVREEGWENLCRRAEQSGAIGNISDSDATITDPDIDNGDDEPHNAGPQGGENPVQTGTDEIIILEDNPSPEREQENRRPEDVPLQSVEQEQGVGPCHACPDFPGTYHHMCAPENPQCVNLLATDYGSPNYGPSHSPQPLQRTGEQVTQAAVAEANRLGAAYGVRVRVDLDRPPQNGSNENSRRTPP